MLLQRFAAAAAVASVIVAAGALVSLLPPRWAPADALVLTTAWCFVPLAWGVWAVAAPAAWVPQRLPLWGGALGVIAGIVAGPVLNLPSRLAGFRSDAIALIAAPVLYYLVWQLVRATYDSLQTR